MTASAARGEGVVETLEGFRRYRSAEVAKIAAPDGPRSSVMDENPRLAAS